MTELLLLPIKRAQNERIDRGGRAREVGQAKGDGGQQSVLPDHETRVQHGAERIYVMVPAGRGPVSPTPP